jgi:dTDP-4-amino-4,6-dideoxygalactose transaminase
MLTTLKNTLVPNGGWQQVLSEFASRFGVRYAFAVSSGRAGLWAVFRVLRRLKPERQVVAVPAYTCFSVPAAVARAGLKLLPVEIDPQTLDFDFAQLESLPADNLLCIVTGNLFGLVNDVPRIRQIAAAKGAFVVDDAAQAMGATFRGCPAGTMGDVGIYSLGRGKALAAVEGGIVVTQSDAIARELRAELASLPPASFTRSATVLAKMVAGSLFLRPSLYWIPNSLPFLKLGVTEYDPNFPVGQLSATSETLFSQLFNQLDYLNDIRRKNAQTLEQALAVHRKFQVLQPLPESKPIYIRFPVIAADAEIQRAALEKLRASGLGASGYYPSAVCDIEAARPHMLHVECHRPAAESVARRMLTLPTHPLVTPFDLQAMVRVLEEC